MHKNSNSNVELSGWKQISWSRRKGWSVGPGRRMYEMWIDEAGSDDLAYEWGCSFGGIKPSHLSLPTLMAEGWKW